jgi:hypothetical protein
MADVVEIPTTTGITKEDAGLPVLRMMATMAILR